MKPVFLLPQMWQKHLALEVRIEKQDARMMREIRKAHVIISSKVLSSVFFLISRGIGSPREIARHTGRSKYAVSLQISKLRQAGLVFLAKRNGPDLRQRNYEVSFDKILQIFRQDYTFELDLYANHLLSESFGEIKGTIANVELVVVGSGRLGLVREVSPDSPLKSSSESEKISTRINMLYLEFQRVFKEYLAERGHSTILEYFLSFYRELSLNHGRLPKESELGQFFEFVDSSIFKIKPLEELWTIAARRDLPALAKKKGGVADDKCGQTIFGSGKNGLGRKVHSQF
jgi:DNA-binding MarR family transcriptional regulator